MGRSFDSRMVIVCSAAIVAISLTAPLAQADVLYEYAQPFEASVNCPTSPVLEISVVFDEPIPPNTPLPSTNNPGRLSWSFSACGETCTSDTQPCGVGGMQEPQSFWFGTDGSGVPDEWLVSKSYFAVPTERVNFTSTLRVGDGIEGDLYQDERTATEGASLNVGSWTVTEIGGAVPLTGPWARVGLSLALIVLGASGLLPARYLRR